VLTYSSYLGGNLSDSGRSIALDSAGSAYVTGFTTSATFPTANGLQQTLAGPQNAFVTKLNAAGSAIVYSTYLGGSGSDAGAGIAVDALGHAIVVGSTSSANFPTKNALQATYGGDPRNAFVAELTVDGSALVYSTYLGGSNDDAGLGIAVDAANHAYLTGYTKSADFPTANALQPASGGGEDAFVAALNPSGSALVYSTY